VKDGITSEQWPANPDFHVNRRVLLHAANLRHGTDGFTSPPQEGMLWIFSPEKSDASAGFEPVILGTRGQHANHLTTEAASDGTCHSHPTARDIIPKDQNRLLFVPHSWEHCQMHDGSLDTPPAIHAFKHWYILNVYQLFCLSVANFTSQRSPSVSEEAQS
jgi:hypothetical protein